MTTTTPAARFPSAADTAATLLPDAPPVRSTLRVTGADPLVPSVHRLADAMSAAVGAFGLQVAGLAEDSGCAPREITVRAADTIDTLRAPFLTTLGGVDVQTVAEDPTALANNGFRRTADGWIFLITTYPHQRDAVCRVLDCPPLRDRIAQEAARWRSVELEDAVCAAGGVAAAVRTGEQWAAHPAGRHLAGRPVVEVERIGDAPPEPVPDRLRVLDDTHVIAGPVAAKLLGTFGADVLHMSRPDLPDPLAMVALTGGGKRNAWLDLRDPAQAATLRDLAGGADVFVNAYRGTAARGFGPQDLAGHRPGIVALDLHCWGADGPWAARGGFDQLACSATGFALEEGAGGPPSLPPTHLLNDYLAAWLGAAGVLAALRRRAVEGGSWRVRVTLAGVCTWVRELGMFTAAQVADLPRPGGPTIGMHVVDGPMGRLVEPVLPLEFDGRPAPLPGPPQLLGTAAATW